MLGSSDRMRACCGRAESDERFGAFDFRAAHAEAPADLQELLDQHESLPFRRRGYERDGMLKTVVDRAGMAQMYASAQEGADATVQALAAVPDDESIQRPV